jgi:hypothetical protein
LDRSGDHWEARLFIAARGQVFEFNPWIVGKRETLDAIAAAIAQHWGQPNSMANPVRPSSWGTAAKWRHRRIGSNS